MRRLFCAVLLLLVAACAEREAEAPAAESALLAEVWGGDALVSDVHADAITVSEKVLYFVEGDGKVSKVSTAGGPPQVLTESPRIQSTLVLSGARMHTQIAVDATHVYWTFPRDRFSSDGGKILRVSKSGGAHEVLVDGLDEPSGVAVDGSHVYFTDRKSGVVAKLPRAGGAVTPLATGETFPRYIATDGVDVFFTANSPTPSPQAGGVMKVSVNGGAKVRVSAPADDFDGLALDGARVYYSATLRNGTPGQPRGVFSAAKAGGDLLEHASAGPIASPLPFALDQDRVYFTNRVQLHGPGPEGAVQLYQNELSRTHGCTCHPVAGVPSAAFIPPRAGSIAVDDDGIYFVTDLLIVRTAKPSP